MFSYKKLEVWKLAKKVALDVYSITRNFPSEEKFCMIPQLNRAAISIASNIAEGSGRTSFKDQAHFTEIAFGSLMEVTCQLEIAKELGFINNNDWNIVNNDIEVLARKLSSLKSSQLRRQISKP